MFLRFFKINHFFEELLLEMFAATKRSISDSLSRVYIGEGYAITLATATASATWNSTCIGHLGRRNTDRIVSIFCRVTQGGQGKFNVAVADGFAYKHRQCKW
jgi:uncharacterized membrane protein